jgi:hypothetical protein
MQCPVTTLDLPTSVLCTAPIAQHMRNQRGFHLQSQHVHPNFQSCHGRNDRHTIGAMRVKVLVVLTRGPNPLTACVLPVHYLCLTCALLVHCLFGSLPGHCLVTLCSLDRTLPVRCRCAACGLSTSLHCLCAQPVHYLCTVCVHLPVHSLFNACKLPVHRLCTVCKLSVHCRRTVYILPIHCLSTAYSLPIHCLFTVYAYSLSIHCIHN